MTAAPAPEIAPAVATEHQPAARRAAPALRAARVHLGYALRNDGIRRLGLAWMLGIAADGALVVVSLVTVFNRGGVIAAGLYGAIRMVPAVAVGMFAGSLLERVRGDRILVVFGVIRAVAAGLIAVSIATAGATMDEHQITLIQLFVFGSIAAAAAAPIRVTQVTLMPAIARSPEELVAANTVWSTGEGVGAFGGPFIAGILMGLNFHPLVAALAGVAFLATSVINAGLKFEQAADASGGAQHIRGRIRLLEGVRAVRGNPVLSWTMFGTYAQVVTRGLLNAMIVVAAIELLLMGQGGTGLLGAALGFGGLAGAIFAISLTRSAWLVRTEILALVLWGLPLAVIGVIPIAEIAVIAMVVIGVANAVYDVALFTILQRATPNENRAEVMSVLEAVIGVGAVSGSLLAPLLLIVLGDQIGLIIAGLILPIVAVAMYLRIGRIEKISVVNEAIVDLVRGVPAFAELPLTGVERLASGLVPFTAEAGTALMTQGEPGDRFLLTATGEIEVIVDGRPIHRLGPGAGVGEIALLRRSPRTATVVAVTDVTGYSVDAATFLAAVAGPAAAAVTERMAQANLQRAAAAS